MSEISKIDTSNITPIGMPKNLGNISYQGTSKIQNTSDMQTEVLNFDDVDVKNFSNTTSITYPDSGETVNYSKDEYGNTVIETINSDGSWKNTWTLYSDGSRTQSYINGDGNIEVCTFKDGKAVKKAYDQNNNEISSIDITNNSQIASNTSSDFLGDVGNSLLTIGATGANILLAATEEVVDMGESVMDAKVGIDSAIESSVVSLFNKDLANQIQEKAKEYIGTDYSGNLYSALYSTPAMQEVQNHSIDFFKRGNEGYNIVEGLTNNAVVLIPSMIFGPEVGAAIGGVTGYGKALEQGYSQGNDYWSVQGGAAISGGWNALQGALAGKLAGAGAIGVDALTGFLDTPINSFSESMVTNKDFGEVFQANGGVTSMVANAALSAGLSGISEYKQGNLNIGKNKAASMIDNTEIGKALPETGEVKGLPSGDKLGLPEAYDTPYMKIQLSDGTTWTGMVKASDLDLQNSYISYADGIPVNMEFVTGDKRIHYSSSNVELVDELGGNYFVTTGALKHVDPYQGKLLDIDRRLASGSRMDTFISELKDKIKQLDDQKIEVLNNNGYSWDQYNVVMDANASFKKLQNVISKSSKLTLDENIESAKQCYESIQKFNAISSDKVDLPSLDEILEAIKNGGYSSKELKKIKNAGTPLGMKRSELNKLLRGITAEQDEYIKAIEKFNSLDPKNSKSFKKDLADILSTGQKAGIFKSDEEYKLACENIRKHIIETKKPRLDKIKQLLEASGYGTSEEIDNYLNSHSVDEILNLADREKLKVGLEAYSKILKGDFVKDDAQIKELVEKGYIKLTEDGKIDPSNLEGLPILVKINDSYYMEVILQHNSQANTETIFHSLEVVGNIDDKIKKEGDLIRNAKDQVLNKANHILYTNNIVNSKFLDKIEGYDPNNPADSKEAIKKKLRDEVVDMVSYGRNKIQNDYLRNISIENFDARIDSLVDEFIEKAKGKSKGRK